jgi:hypothetical protein
LRGLDLNQRPSGYEPDELPGCSTPRDEYVNSENEIKSKSAACTTIQPMRPGLAPAVGFEPTTNRLTADRSTTELRWITSLKTANAYFRARLRGGNWQSIPKRCSNLALQNFLFFLKLRCATGVACEQNQSLHNKSSLTRVYENTREPNCYGIEDGETLRHLRTRDIAGVAAEWFVT